MLKHILWDVLWYGLLPILALGLWGLCMEWADKSKLLERHTTTSLIVIWVLLLLVMRP